MNKNMQIAIDLDGVVLNTMKALCNTHHLNLDYETVPFPFNFYPLLNITKEEGIHLFETIDPDLVIPFPGAIRGLELMSQDFQIFFLTDKTPKMMVWTKNILKQLGLDKYPIMVSNAKHLENCYDILIEDKGQTYIDCKNQSKICFLIDRAWNRDYEYMGGERFSDLVDVAIYLHSKYVFTKM